MSENSENQCFPNAGEIIFYTKQDCGLCNEMLENLNKFISEFDENSGIVITMRDIEENPAWYERYREYVPVLVVGGEEVCHYFFDEKEFMAAISG